MSAKTEVLTLKWTTSRGQDTYGYNIVTLRNGRGEVVGRAMGGGYDMVGTVFGQWLEATHQDTYGRGRDDDYRVTRPGLDGLDVDAFYGARRRDDGTVSLDGACGLESMVSIAEALGLTVERMWDKRGNTTGWVVQS